MAGVRKKPNTNGKYQGWYIDQHGKQKFFWGSKSSKETKEMAEGLEAEHRQIRLGYRPAPSPAAKHQTTPFDKVKDEYLAWGEAQGGRGGRPWGSTHARNRRSHLAWWSQRLGMQTLADLTNIIARVEAALRDLQKKGRTGKTIAHYAEALSAFCDWCVDREYLADDPLKALTSFDTTPQTHRRAMTVDEISRLLDVCAPHRKLLLETAFLSGLRAKELLSLTINDLDLEENGLHLDASWTKNRKKGFQPLAIDLVHRLNDFALSGEPARLYAKFYRRKDAKLAAPDNPLLYVPSYTARDLDKDLKTAGIPKLTGDGKLDFHACRLAYINFVLETGASVKEAQALARHSTPELTMNVYGRTRKERLSETAEKVAANVLPAADNAIFMPRQAVGAEHESATPIDNRELRLSEDGGGGGNRTRRNQKHHRHNRATLCRKFLTKQRIAALANLYQTT